MTEHPPHHDESPVGDGSTLEAQHAAEHDDHGAGGHGHGAADPNAGVVRGTPPTPAWVLTAALIALVTIIATVVLAIALDDAIPSKAPTEHTTEQGAEPAAEH
jgi:hypothetical protein